MAPLLARRCDRASRRGAGASLARRPGIPRTCYMPLT
jgi:hypothetical protein